MMLFRYGLISLLVLASFAIGAQAVGTAFTYQGQLQVVSQSGAPVAGDGAFDFTFSLFDAITNGDAIGTPLFVEDVVVSDGIFTIELDFGLESYTGDQLWMQIEVRNGAATGEFSELSPRQALTTAPFAILAESVALGSVGEAEVEPTEVQLRVDESCPESMSISSINEDGSVNCESDDDEQTLSLTGTVLSVSGGNSVDLDQALLDESTTNELNTGLTLDGTNLTVTDAGGDRSADLSSLSMSSQTLSVEGNSLAISDGNAVDLTPVLDDNDAANELNTAVTFDGTNITISDAGDDQSADLSALANDDTNELNSGVGFDGTNLTVVDAGGDQSVDLSVLANNDTNELNTGLEFDGTNVTVNDAGGSQSADLSALINDDDNELNTGVSFDGTNLSVIDAGGSQSADLSPLVNDDDNELNTGISFSGTLLTVSDAGGNQSVSLASVANNDINELNTGFSLSGNIISVTDAAGTLSEDLSGFLDNTDAQTLDLSGTSLSISGGNAIDLSALFGDTDPSNELNTSLSFDGSNLSLTDAGGVMSADLSGLSDTAAEVLAKLLTVDGADSGLDAELLDGMQATDLLAAVPTDNRIPITSIPFTISEPGSYVVTQDLVNTTDDTNGINVNADNVTIDLGGFRLTADMNPPTGIGISGRTGILIINQFNVHISNGHISGWDATGVSASSCDNCIFENLVINDNGSLGLRAGPYSLISNVTVGSNGVAGLSVGESTAIAHSAAYNNGGSGFISSSSAIVINCASVGNEGLGFSMSTNTNIFGSAAVNNELDGFRLGTGSTGQQLTSYENGQNGFLVISAMLRDSIAALNGNQATDVQDDNGIFANGNAYIINNHTFGNEGAGIRVQFADTVVEQNIASTNRRAGIETSSSGESLIIGNRATGNGPDASNILNYDFGARQAFGPIIDISGVGDISTVAGANHPLANYEY